LSDTSFTFAEEGSLPMEKNTTPQSEAIALYNVYRDYMKHEDTLMNVRMTWFLTTQAFLFSCYTNPKMN